MPLILLLSGCVSFSQQNWRDFVQAGDRDLCVRDQSIDDASYQQLPIFLITSRLPDCRGASPILTKQRTDQIRYGRYKASGTRKKPGKTEMQFRQRAYWQADLEKAVGPSRRVMVFIHGYNNYFDEIAVRTQAMRQVTGFEGPIITYSWPSFQAFFRYTVDEANNLWDQPYFYGELLSLARTSNIDDIVVVSHSMGTRSLLAAMERMSRQPDTRKYLDKFRTLIFASGDLDRQIFERSAKNELFSENMMGAQRHITVFTSNVDRAVGISRILHGYDRLGITKCNDPNIKEPCYPRDPETGEFFDGVTVVDTSNVSGGIIGHADFIDSLAGREYLCAAVLNDGVAIRKLPKLVMAVKSDAGKFCPPVP
jgi:esterase/lipase superfamily enzyme